MQAGLAVGKHVYVCLCGLVPRESCVCWGRCRRAVGEGVPSCVHLRMDACTQACVRSCAWPRMPSRVCDSARGSCVRPLSSPSAAQLTFI